MACKQVSKQTAERTEFAAGLRSLATGYRSAFRGAGIAADFARRGAASTRRSAFRSARINAFWSARIARIDAMSRRQNLEKVHNAFSRIPFFNNAAVNYTASYWSAWIAGVASWGAASAFRSASRRNAFGSARVANRGAARRAGRRSASSSGSGIRRSGGSCIRISRRRSHRRHRSRSAARRSAGSFRAAEPTAQFSAAISNGAGTARIARVARRGAASAFRSARIAFRNARSAFRNAGIAFRGAGIATGRTKKASQNAKILSREPVAFAYGFFIRAARLE